MSHLKPVDLRGLRWSSGYLTVHFGDAGPPGPEGDTFVFGVTVRTREIVQTVPFSEEWDTHVFMNR